MAIPPDYNKVDILLYLEAILSGFIKKLIFNKGSHLIGLEAFKLNRFKFLSERAISHYLLFWREIP
jgi:hypothetical protein